MTEERSGASPVLSVTLVLHNSEDSLASCLRGLRPAVESGFAELIAVDNASPDESADLLRQEVPGARIIRSPLNRGFAAGANLAWPHVRGRYWMLLNPDVVTPCDALERLVAWMDAHPELGAASPELLDEDGGGTHSTGRALPSAVRSALELSRLHLLLPRRTRGRLLRGPYWAGGDQLDADWVPGTAMVVRTEAVDQIGLLDESFFLYGEDIEWCSRMRSGGWRIGACSTVTMRHSAGSSAQRTLGEEDRLRRLARAELDVVKRERGTTSARLYGAVTMFGLALESVHPRRRPAERERARSFSRAYRAALRRPQLLARSRDA